MSDMLMIEGFMFIFIALYKQAWQAYTPPTGGDSSRAPVLSAGWSVVSAEKDLGYVQRMMLVQCVQPVRG